MPSSGIVLLALGLVVPGTLTAISIWSLSISPLCSLLCHFILSRRFSGSGRMAPAVQSLFPWVCQCSAEVPADSHWPTSDQSLSWGGAGPSECWGLGPHAFAARGVGRHLTGRDGRTVPMLFPEERGGLEAGQAGRQPAVTVPALRCSALSFSSHTYRFTGRTRGWRSRYLLSGVSTRLTNPAEQTV